MDRPLINALLGDALADIGDRGVSGGGSAARFAARFLPTREHSECVPLSLNAQDAALRIRAALFPVARRWYTDTTNNADTLSLEFLYQHGAFSNPAVILVDVREVGPDESKVTVTAFAKEGLIKQHTARRSVERLLVCLRNLQSAGPDVPAHHVRLPLNSDLNARDHDPEYLELMDTVSRRPIRPAVGVPLFAALFALALVAKNVARAEYAGLVLLFLNFVFPYYVVQLLMAWRMQRHLDRARLFGREPTYVPSNPRAWASLYIVLFFAVVPIVMWIDSITKP